MRDEVTSNYFSTTASRSRELNDAYYSQASKKLGGIPWVRPWLPENRDTPVLDLGCGCGEFLYALEHRGYSNLRGVDACKEEVDQGARFTSAALAHGDVLDFVRNCPSGSLGLVTAFNLLEHLEDDKLLALLQEVQRVLAPGATLIAMVPNAVSPLASIPRYWDITHQRAFTGNNFVQLAAVTGFGPRVDMMECGPVPHGLKSAARFAAWQIVRTVVATMLIIEVANTKGRVYTMDMMVRMHRP